MDSIEGKVCSNDGTHAKSGVQHMYPRAYGDDIMTGKRCHF